MVCAENLIRKPVDLALHSKLISVGMHDQEDTQVDVWAQNLPFFTAELQPLAVLWLYGRAYFWHPNPGRVRSKRRNWDHTLSQAPFSSQGLFSGRSAFWRAVSRRPSPILVWLICPLRGSAGEGSICCKPGLCSPRHRRLAGRSCTERTLGSTDCKLVSQPYLVMNL